MRHSEEYSKMEFCLNNILIGIGLVTLQCMGWTNWATRARAHAQVQSPVRVCAASNWLLFHPNMMFLLPSPFLYKINKTILIPIVIVIPPFKVKYFKVLFFSELNINLNWVLWIWLVWIVSFISYLNRTW